MTPEHKALVERLDAVLRLCEIAEAKMAEKNAAIESLAAENERLRRADDEYEAVCKALQTKEAENDGFRSGWEIALERAVTAEERADALIAELRAKETEIEALAVRLDAQGSELADYAKTVQELRRRKP